jgi:hypothetical protein
MSGRIAFLLAALVLAVRVEAETPVLAISGTPETSVNARVRYNFTPSSFVQSDQGFYFEIANKPAWATFDPIWGRLSGMPTEEDVGVYRAVSISLVSGETRVALPDFNLLVKAPLALTVATPPRFVTLRWDVPQANVDGTPLDDLAGYIILLGSDPQDLRPLRTLDAVPEPIAVLTDLPDGVNCVAVRAYNRIGRPGPPTDAVCVWIAPNT